MSLFFLQTAMLWTAALAAVVVILHVILPRWKRRAVPSLLIWRRVRERGLGASARRLSVDVVLLLAALTVIALVFASIDPRLVAERPSRGQLVVVIDNGTSSLSEGEGGATRLAEAAAAARRAVDEIADRETVAVIATSPAPHIVAPPGVADVARHALSGVRGVHVSGDVDAALALARATGSSNADILLVSGRLPAEVPPRVRTVRVGRGSRNLAIVRADFAARRAFCGLRNFGDRDVATVVSLRVMSPEPSREVSRRDVTVPADGRLDVVLEVADAAYRAASVVRLSHQYAEDDLHVDDAVWAARLPAGARRVTVVGEASEPLARALWAAGAQVTHRPASDKGSPAKDTDAIVLAGIAPTTWPPSVPAIFVRPPGGIDGIEMIGDELRDVAATFAIDDSPDSLVTGFPPGVGITVARASRARFFVNRVPLITAGSEVLAARFDAGGLSHTYLGFDPVDSDWATRASFPVFVARALERARTTDDRDAPLGFAVAGTTPERLLPVGVTTLVGPDGEEVSRAASLSRVGLYPLRPSRPDGTRRVLAVNLVSARESDNRPSALPSLPDDAHLHPETASSRVQARALAPLLALVALALCVGEWYLSSRRD